MQRIKSTYQRFNNQYWILVFSSFIDRLGGTLIFPFFSLYITAKFDVGMAQAGLLLGSFSFFGFLGSMVGGALADRFGRKGMVIFGLVFSATSSVAFGLVNQFSTFFIIAVFVGFLSDVAGPAHQAMVADLLPEEQRSEGYSILRVAINLAWIIGPTIGGVLAHYSYMLLFVLDAISSLIVAMIVLRFIPETKPQTEENEAPESLGKTLGGYLSVARDGLFVAFILANVFTLFAYGQIYNTLSVFLRDVHGLPDSGYGFLMSANAALVVLMQFWVTSRIKRWPPMLVMALGVGFYMVGLSLYGFVATFPFFLVAMLIITVGEMIVMPVSQALAAQFAPEQMRGRYMAFFGISWIVPSIFGPSLSGLVLDGPIPQMLWYLSGLSCAVAIAGFFLLHQRAGEQFRTMEKAQAGD